MDSATSPNLRACQDRVDQDQEELNALEAEQAQLLEDQRQELAELQASHEGAKLRLSKQVLAVRDRLNDDTEILNCTRDELEAQAKQQEAAEKRQAAQARAAQRQRESALAQPPFPMEEEDQKRISSSRETAPAPESRAGFDTPREQRLDSPPTSRDPTPEPVAGPSTLHRTSSAFTIAPSSSAPSSAKSKGKKRAAVDPQTSPAKRSQRGQDRCMGCTEMEMGNLGNREFGLIKCDIDGCKAMFCYRHITTGGSKHTGSTQTFNHHFVRTPPWIAVCRKHRQASWDRCTSKCLPDSVEQWPFIDKEVRTDEQPGPDDLVFDCFKVDDHLEVVYRPPTAFPNVVRFRRFEVLGIPRDYRWATDAFMKRADKTTEARCLGCNDRNLSILSQLELRCQAKGCDAIKCARCAKISHNPNGWLCDPHLNGGHPRHTTKNWHLSEPSQAFVVQMIYQPMPWSALEERVYTGKVLFKDRKKELDECKEEGLFDCELLGFPNSPRHAGNRDMPAALVTFDKLLELCPERLPDRLNELKGNERSYAALA